MDTTQLESAYEAEITAALSTAAEKYGYSDDHFSAKLAAMGAMMAGLSVASKEAPSAMLLFMKDKGESGLSVEAITVKDLYKSLFPEEILELCRTKLADAGFVPPAGW
ncbi:MAG: hypothetical protein LBU99_02395 [Spirochaetaceae bacterium]|jgi:hypothetical protein|nr:hypothetical protein [Spirochaetaceae bacterium]